MTKNLHRYFTVATAVIPTIAVFVAMVLLWNELVSWLDLVLLVVFYTLTGLGVHAGFHRMLTHRAFATYRPIKIGIAVLGTMGAEGPPITWVSQHRKHHATADNEGDPHSPHLHGEGLKGALKGLWHAHFGWLVAHDLNSEPLRYAPDLVRDPAMRWISKHMIGLVVLGIVLPGLIAFAITGEVAAALTGMLWGGLVRIFLLTQATFAVNSIGHFFGRRRFATPDQSRNVMWLALPSFGEGWHHNHHAFPSSYRHGLRWWEIDTAAMFIRLLEALGLAWDVVRISPESQRAKEIAAASPVHASSGTKHASAGR